MIVMNIMEDSEPAAPAAVWRDASGQFPTETQTHTFRLLYGDGPEYHSPEATIYFEALGFTLTPNPSRD